MAPPFLKTRYEQDIRLLPRGGGMVIGVGLLLYIILLLSIQKFSPVPMGTHEWLELALAYGIFMGAILYRYGMSASFYGVLLVAALSVPILGGENIVSVMSYYYIFSLAGLSLYFLVGLSGQVSLGHGAFMACGAYSAALLQGAGYDLIIGFPLAIGITALLGFVFGLSVGRLPLLFIALATFAFAFIVLEFLSQWDVVGGFRGMQIEQTSSLLGMVVAGEAERYYLTFGVLVLALLAVLNVERSATGRAMRAVKDSEHMARSVGVNSVHYKALAFAFSAGLMGAAGALYANWVVYLEPGAFDFMLSISLLAMVFIGGFGRVHGVFFGAFFLVFLPQGLSMIVDGFEAGASFTLVSEPVSKSLQACAEFFARPVAETAALGVAILIVARFAPYGLIGGWQRVRDYFRAFPLYRSSASAEEIDSGSVWHRQ